MMNRGKLEKHSHEGDEDEKGEQGQVQEIKQRGYVRCCEAADLFAQSTGILHISEAGSEAANFTEQNVGKIFILF